MGAAHLPDLRRLPVVEIFGPVLQGEGMLIGVPTAFVRFGGCDSACSWCDSMHAVDAKRYRHTWRRMATEEIVAELVAAQAPLITLSGGNPALHDLYPLIRDLHAAGRQVALETQGTRHHRWFADLDHLILSPKPPSSGYTAVRDEVAGCLQAAGPFTRTSLKFVILDEGDFAWAHRFARDLADHTHLTPPVFLQVANAAPPPARFDLPALLERGRWLERCILQAGWWDARLLFQQHTLLHGNTQGV